MIANSEHRANVALSCQKFSPTPLQKKATGQRNMSGSSWASTRTSWQRNFGATSSSGVLGTQSRDSRPDVSPFLLPGNLCLFKSTGSVISILSLLAESLIAQWNLPKMSLGPKVYSIFHSFCRASSNHRYLGRLLRQN
jgi:hypothetical protein